MRQERATPAHVADRHWFAGWLLGVHRCACDVSPDAT